MITWPNFRDHDAFFCQRVIWMQAQSDGWYFGLWRKKNSVRCVPSHAERQQIVVFGLPTQEVFCSIYPQLVFCLWFCQKLFNKLIFPRAIVREFSLSVSFWPWVSPLWLRAVRCSCRVTYDTVYLVGHNSFKHSLSVYVSKLVNFSSLCGWFALSLKWSTIEYTLVTFNYLSYWQQDLN